MGSFERIVEMLKFLTQIIQLYSGTYTAKNLQPKYLIHNSHLNSVHETRQRMMTEREPRSTT